MKSLVMKKVVGILTVLAMLVSISIVAPVSVKAANTTYYVDSVGGNDSNVGTSTSTAWKSLSKVNAKTFAAGDKILFKAGSSYTGTLHPLGSGASGNPIIIDRYSSGNKPIINGNGATNAVYLTGQSYWEINNLEVTNNASSEGNRRGIFLEAVGTANHLYVKNCYVHNVRGNNDFSSGKPTGGISLMGNGSSSSKFNDVLIDNNTINYCDRTGIYIGDGCGDGYVSTNVVVRNNTINYPGGDGAIIMYCMNPLIEYNIVNTSDNVSTEVSAGIWSWYCSGAVFQYNEGYNCKYSADLDDGMPWDIDGGNLGCIYQYNYSHDNEGGSIMLCADAAGPSNNSIIRYNISQNDGGRVLTLTGPSTNTYYYNNTSYLSSSMSSDVIGAVNLEGNHSNLYVYNNIFYNLGSGGYDIGETTGNVFDYNVYYGNHPLSEPSDAHKLTSNPMLVNPGSGGTGRTTVDGYKIQAGSPCIDSGKTISNNGGKDYWGTTVPQNSATDRGACEYVGTVAPAVPTGLSATSASSSQINISWNTVLGATGYDLLVDGTTLTSVTSPYAHTGLSASSTHGYQVRAKNSSDSSAWSSTVSATTQSDGSSNLALNKTASTSSVEGTGFEAAKAFDGNATTRWASSEGSSPSEWLSVDLGNTQSISKVILKWEAAYAVVYKIQTSTDGTNFTDAVSVTNGTGGTVTKTFTVTNARYVRIYCTTKLDSDWGYSLYEVEVYNQ